MCFFRTLSAYIYCGYKIVVIGDNYFKKLEHCSKQIYLLSQIWIANQIMIFEYLAKFFNLAGIIFFDTIFFSINGGQK